MLERRDGNVEVDVLVSQFIDEMSIEIHVNVARVFMKWFE